jgi:hypothetical protein
MGPRILQIMVKLMYRDICKSANLSEQPGDLQNVENIVFM